MQGETGLVAPPHDEKELTMRNLIKTLGLTLSLTMLAPALATRAHAEAGTPTTAAVKPDFKKVEQHLRDHQQYPATRAELLASCNNLVDFSAGEKRWFADHLAEGTYKSADEVMKSIRRK
jgi:hypothetical protein